MSMHGDDTSEAKDPLLMVSPLSLSSLACDSHLSYCAARNAAERWAPSFKPALYLTNTA